MTDDPDDFTPPPRRSRFRRLRKVALWIAGLVALLLLVAFVGRWQVGRVGQRRLDAATRQLDAADADWRLEAVVGAHNASAPPPKENAARQVAELSERVPQEFREWQQSESAGRWLPRDPDNRRPPDDALAAAQAVAPRTLLVRTEALGLRDRRRGVTPLDLTADPFALTLPHVDKARKVASLLQYDGYLAALEGNPNRGVSSARAALGVARSLGDEPLFVSQLVRMAIAKVGAQTALQVLAWSEPTEGLAELQAELLAEADVPWFRTGMRGERAFLDRVFQAVEDGSLTPEQFFRYVETGKPSVEHFAAFRAYRALLPGDRATCLRLCTEYVEASKLPPHEQLAAIKQISLPWADGDRFQNVMTRLVFPACERFAESGLRARTDLLAAASCVACERFRRKEGRWPRDLTELVPAYLPTVPQNPFDGRPLTYRVHADRVVVFHFWANASVRYENQPADLRDGKTPGLGIGYRVWNPDRRGLPAEPEEKNEP